MPITLDDFRRVALSLEGAVEGAHLGNPDFRVAGKIFATFGGGTGRPVVKLTPEEQAVLVEAEPEMFAPVDGGWGRQGSTRLNLAHTDEATALDALTRAWRNVGAPRPRKRR